jgi:putative oxidoreductase
MATIDATPTDSTKPAAKSRKGMHWGLWIAQGILGATFLLAGLGHLVQPIAALRAQNPWIGGAMGQFVRFIGAVEVLGAVGLILPAATRIKPSLTPLAALGLTTVMVLAGLTHVERGEVFMLPVNAALGGLAGFVAWGRWRKAPIGARSSTRGVAHADE